MIIKKRWRAFWAVETAGLLIYILLCAVSPRAWVVAAAGGIFVLLSVYWCWYYYSLEYSTAERTLLITSGIIFRRERRLPAENILWEMRLSLLSERKTAATILHTAGGITVIFGEISTSPG
ncbi:MAG: hypothetical protein SPD47_03355 [Oscillospiraceae bacterium]|nr:hypothetical protein [Oscillospiraceae bacterium]